MEKLDSSGDSQALSVQGPVQAAGPGKATETREQCKHLVNGSGRKIKFKWLRVLA